MILLLCIATLFKSNLFINSFYTQQFAYLFIGALLITTTGFSMIVNANKKNTALTFLTLLIFVTVIYILLNGFILDTNISVKALLLVTSYLLCLALPILIKPLNFKPTTIINLLIIIGIVEIIWFVLQYTTIKTDNKLFSVGAWINPNITAIFLTLLTPFLLYDSFHSKKKGSIIIFSIFLFAIIILKCRTAYLGILVVTILVFGAKFINKGMQIKITFKKAAIFFILLITSLGSLYFFKKNSSDSRVFIWTQSIKMIAKEPLLGYGYGSFERNFNLFQAGYFERGNYTIDEVTNAAHTNMAYNEFIETTIEGGLIGLLLFCSFIGFILFIGLKTINKNIKEKSFNNDSDKKVLFGSTIGIITLIFMSIINFTILALPLMVLFTLFTVFIINYSSASIKNTSLTPASVKLIGITLIAGGICLAVNVYSYCISELKIAKAAKLGMKKEYPTALNILESVSFCNNQDYYQILANVQYYSGDKKNAFSSYKNATKYYSTPELYQQLGNCAIANNQFSIAVKNYHIASNIQPNRFTPKYLLMQHYSKIRDTANTIKLATEIIEMDEKIPSPKIDMYKTIATQFIKKIN